ncbi:MAG TPA: hypothetical protein DCK87_02225 [Desulfotomaculum sp.]|nr:hypothetical protein [Desulfotomaculum sp.]
MEYIIERHSQLGRAESKWEIASAEESEFFDQRKDSKGGDIPNNATWIKVILDWNEYTGAIKKYEKACKRIAGLRNAISKWAKKAGNKSAASQSELIFAELAELKVNKEYEYTEHWTILIEKNPHLAREAWEWIRESGKIDFVKRMYYHQKHGWVMALRVEW